MRSARAWPNSGPGAPGPLDLKSRTATVRFLPALGAAGPEFGQALAERITSALADRQEAVISQDRVRKGDLGGARLILSGGVERDGPLLRVRVQFDDARAGRAVWSGVYERSAGDLLALQDQAANSVASIISGVTDLGPNARRTSPELLAAYMTAVESGLEHRASNEQSREAFRRLAALVPRASRVHARYAVVIMDSLIFSQESPEAIARWRALATAEANKAIALRPHDAYSYVALLDTLPRWAFPEREALLNLALAAVADDPDLLSVQVGHLGEVGRPAEALAIAEQAMTLGRATPSRVTDLIFRLAGAGRWPDASALGQRQARLTPANNSTRRANLLTAIIYAPPAEALQAIDRYQATDPHLAPEAEAAWRDVVAARAGKLPAGAAAKAVAAAPRGEYGVDPSTAMSAYSMLGRLDLAFAEVERAQGGHYEFYIANLFQGATVAMRRDPRFMPMAARLGLVDYWMKSGHWPDFCQDPGLPYDCRAAARAATQAPGRSRAPNRT